MPDRENPSPPTQPDQGGDVDDARHAFIVQLSSDLQRVKEFDDGTMARVGAGLLTTAGIVVVWIDWLLEAERQGPAALLGAAFRGLLLYWMVAYGLRLLSLERNPKGGALDFPWRLHPYGIAARHPTEAPQRYHLFLRVVTIGIAAHFLQVSGAPFWKPALVFLILLDIVHMVTAELAHVAYKARAKTQPLGEVNLSKWEKYYDASKLVFPFARVVLAFILLNNMSDPTFSPSDDWIQNLRITVGAAAALLTTHYTLQHVWLYDTKMHRSLGMLRMLLAREQLTAVEGRKEYLQIYSTGGLSKALHDRLPQLDYDFKNRAEKK